MNRRERMDLDRYLTRGPDHLPGLPGADREH